MVASQWLGGKRMSERDGVTTSTKEATIDELLSRRNVLSVPYFQRPYKWRKERLGQFQQDVLSLVAGETDYHFFGAVILNGHASPATDGHPQLSDVGAPRSQPGPSVDGRTSRRVIMPKVLGYLRFLCGRTRHRKRCEAWIGYEGSQLIGARSNACRLTYPSGA